ncbi:hypothetical protein ACFTAO_31505 [Paenibacillus rhizoplanae]
MTKETGGQVGAGIDPVLFVQNRKKSSQTKVPQAALIPYIFPNPSLTSKV